MCISLSKMCSPLIVRSFTPISLPQISSTTYTLNSMLPLKTLSSGKVTKMVLTPPKVVTTSYCVITTTPLSPPHSWFWIWKLKLPAKIIFFFWLAYHHLVPTLSLLNHQKMNTSSLCTRCGLKVETFLHCVRDYIFSRNLWHHIGFSDPTFLSLMDAHDSLRSVPRIPKLTSYRLGSGGHGYIVIWCV
jgi:hypothetical protein